MKAIAEKVEKTTPVKVYVDAGKLFSGLKPKEEGYAEDACTYVYGYDL